MGEAIKDDAVKEEAKGIFLFYIIVTWRALIHVFPLSCF